MTEPKILEALSPFGLSCEKCFAHIDGDIRNLSIQLKEKLGNFEIYAKQFEILEGNPIFKKYSDFKQMLNYFASKDCKGCRGMSSESFLEPAGSEPVIREKY
jgi:hypothetical protein